MAQKIIFNSTTRDQEKAVEELAIQIASNRFDVKEAVAEAVPALSEKFGLQEADARSMLEAEVNQQVMYLMHPTHCR